MSGIVLKPANRAAQLYVGGSGVQQAVRQQHQYVLVYNLYPIREDDFLDEKIGYLKEFRDRLHFLCNTVDGPKFQIQQDVLNQYNRKRVVNRKIDYDPLTVRMYDTVDGLGIKFVRTLYEFEFANARLYKTKAGGAPLQHQEQANYVQTVLQNSNRFVETHHFGMKSHRYYHRLLKSIDLYQMAGGTFSKVRMIHPRISRMDMDNFAYESSSPVNLNLAFTYENLVFEETNVKLDGSDPEYPIDTMMSETADFEDIEGTGGGGGSTGSVGAPEVIAPSITKKIDNLISDLKSGDWPKGDNSANAETTAGSEVPPEAKPFKGSYNQKTHKLKNYNDKTYVVPRSTSTSGTSTKSTIGGKSLG